MSVESAASAPYTAGRFRSLVLSASETSLRAAAASGWAVVPAWLENTVLAFCEVWMKAGVVSSAMVRFRA